jgi:hypothetical protein
MSSFENTSLEILISNAKKLYLNDKYLRMVKIVNMNGDSKSGVDRPTKTTLDKTLEALYATDEDKIEDVKKFFDEFMLEPGYEITRAEFTDWSDSPKYIESINSDSLKKFSYFLNETWKCLYKKVDFRLLVKGSVSSHLPMQHPFIVPGILCF